MSSNVGIGGTWNGVVADGREALYNSCSCLVRKSVSRCFKKLLYDGLALVGGAGAKIVDSKISNSFQNGVASSKDEVVVEVSSRGRVALLHHVMIWCK